MHACMLVVIISITANQGFYLLGLDNTSPTFASAIQNSVPAITFAMAAALRIEKVRLDRRDGVAKVAGTLACVAGASVITLYKGPTIFGPGGGGGLELASTSKAVAGDKNWTLGCVYLIGHCLSWSGWLVLQAPVLKKYPARLSVTSYTCFFGVIQFLIIAAFMERDADAWKFHSGSELFTILYAVSIYISLYLLARLLHATTTYSYLIMKYIHIALYIIIRYSNSCVEPKYLRLNQIYMMILIMPNQYYLVSISYICTLYLFSVINLYYFL
jgi:drug/metabolite transporter (DMT)-like permease